MSSPDRRQSIAPVFLPALRMQPDYQDPWSQPSLTGFSTAARHPLASMGKAVPNSRLPSLDGLFKLAKMSEPSEVLLIVDPLDPRQNADHCYDGQPEQARIA